MFRKCETKINNMIISKLQDSWRIESLHPQFSKLFAYIKSHSWADAPLERVTIDGDNLFINNSVPTIHTKEDQVLEVHRQYIDVHVLLEGNETMGWSPLSDLNEAKGEYNSAKDCQFFTDKPHSYVDMVPGEFAIVYPEDAHAPNISTSPLHKLVAKIRI